MGKSKMQKVEIAEAVFEDPVIKAYGFTKNMVGVIVSTFLDTLKESIEALKAGDRIELRNFGTFGIKQRKARAARNPKTNEAVKVPAHKSLYFKAGKDMKKNIRTGKKK